VARDAREEFTDRVKAIDPIFKRGDLETFWPSLRALLAMAPDRRDLSQKKSHYLASLAARSLARDDPDAALAFLEYADRTVNRDHLTVFLLKERAEFQRMAQDAIRTKRTQTG
jgi:hypothetical protein